MRKYPIPSAFMDWGCYFGAEGLRRKYSRHGAHYWRAARTSITPFCRVLIRRLEPCRTAARCPSYRLNYSRLTSANAGEGGNWGVAVSRKKLETPHDWLPGAAKCSCISRKTTPKTYPEDGRGFWGNRRPRELRRLESCDRRIEVKLTRKQKLELTHSIMSLISMLTLISKLSLISMLTLISKLTLNSKAICTLSRASQVLNSPRRTQVRVGRPILRLNLGSALSLRMRRSRPTIDPKQQRCGGTVPLTMFPGGTKFSSVNN
ncbi:unnamed protein product [Nesidiocoris tenuis]|uniref:Uncharacterized protein n=1 Tax=Nesidiocoris tenuis TaxID=355587 RepID=A0A6H5H4R4_9HEMI|nr:unnamed protein product [Nesidiocoris tenuis]